MVKVQVALPGKTIAATPIRFVACTATIQTEISGNATFDLLFENSLLHLCILRKRKGIVNIAAQSNINPQVN